MSVTIEDLLSRLEGVRRRGHYWMARCPCHEDSTPSLSVKLADGKGSLPEGSIIFKCHGGCSKENIVSALGLEITDLIPKQRSPPRIAFTYDYTDENDQLLYQKVRYIPKNFSVRVPDPSAKDGWRKKLPSSARKVLYHLSEVLAQAERGGWVFICEGEKDADSIRQLGLVATSNVYGAGEWLDGYSRQLMGAKCCILPDNDEQGDKHAAKVAAAIDAHGGYVSILELPDLPEKGDATDWVEHGGVVEELLRMAERQPRWERPIQGNPEEVEAAVFGRELWMARRVVKKHGESIRYIGAWNKWFVFNGNGVWERDVSGHVERKIKTEADALVNECVRDIEYGGRAQSTREGKERLNVALDHFNCRKQGYVERLARTEVEVIATPDQWDANPWLLSLTNGTIDLRTREMRKPRREDFITKQAGVAFDPNAECPRWEKFIREIVPDDNVRKYLQRVVGYCLTGVIREHAVNICWGDGANGKTTMWECIADVLGDYAGPAPESLLMQDGRAAHETELSVLYGKRLVVVSETPEGGRLNENRMKRITGSDRIMCRRMREDHWDFKPSHKLIVFTNHKPVIKSTDYGTWRRLKLVPFTRKFTEEQMDMDLPQKLRKELPGILNWALKGCEDWYTGGLRPPEQVEMATHGWAHSEDIVGQWLAERTREADTFSASAQLYRDFKAWAEDEGEKKPIGQRTLTRRLTDRGLEYVSAPVRGFRGIRLLTAYEAEREPIINKAREEKEGRSERLFE